MKLTEDVKPQEDVTQKLCQAGKPQGGGGTVVSRTFRKTEVSGKPANDKLTSFQLGIQCKGQQNVAGRYLKTNAL